VSRAQKTRNREQRVSATSQERNEARRVAYGDQNASQRRIAFEVDLGDVFSARTMRRPALGFGRGLGEDLGEYLKGANVRSKDCSRESRAVGVTRARVLPGHEVGDGPDLWVPPGSETGRETRSSVAAASWRARLTGRSSVGRESGPRGKERREGEEGSRPWGGGKDWAAVHCAGWAEIQGEGGGENKYFSNSIFKPLLN